MRVLGVDPGTQHTGWGIVEARGSSLKGIGAGVIRCSAKQALSLRLQHIHAELSALISAESPDAIAVEDVFYAKYANAALKLGHVRGVVLLAAAQAQLPLHSYAPAVVKQCVAGRGRASKEQVNQFVAAMLGGFVSQIRHDASDALAIAITCLRVKPWMQAARRAAPMMRLS